MAVRNRCDMGVRVLILLGYVMGLVGSAEGGNMRRAGWAWPMVSFLD